jgi:hypothetical protein
MIWTLTDVCRYKRIYEYAWMHQLFILTTKLRIFEDEHSSVYNIQYAGLPISAHG